MRFTIQPDGGKPFCLSIPNRMIFSRMVFWLLPQLSKLLGVSVDLLLSGEVVPAVQVQPQATRKKPEDMVLHLIATEPGGDRMTMNLPIVLVKAAL